MFILPGLIGNTQRNVFDKAAAGGAFDPLDLFTSEVGFVLDFTDLSTLFQDTAGTTPVTAHGDPIARVNDLTGNNVDFTSATNTPLYNTTLGFGCVKFDGVNDQLLYNSGGGLATAKNIGYYTMIASFNHPAAFTDAIIVLISRNASGSTRTGMFKFSDGKVGLFSRRADGDTATATARTGDVHGTNIVAVCQWNYTANTTSVAVDKGSATTGTASSSGGGSTSNTDSVDIAMGLSGAGLSPSSCYLNRVIAIPRELTAGELEDAIEWCGAGQGRSL